MDEWDILPGQILRRSDLHDKYGGGRRGGMEPSSVSANVFLFTSPKAGNDFGYEFDGWHPDGTFHYTGEGQVGDQVMTHGNRAVLDHQLKRRRLRLFEKISTDVIYIGEFELPNESYVLIDEAPDRNKSALRSVFVFRLRPVGPTWTAAGLTAPAGTLTMDVPLEASNVENYFFQRAASEPVIGLREESALVGRYADWIALKTGSKSHRHAVPTPAGHLMFTDLFVESTRELVEAKSSSSRQHMRLALGQVLDYARYVDHSSLAVLTPTRPAGELIDLMTSHGVNTIWETSKQGQFDRVSVAELWSA